MDEQTIVMFGRTFTNRYSRLLPPQTEDEMVRLRGSIKKYGILLPVRVDEEDNVLDGWGRLRIASEQGLAEVPIKVVYGLNDQQKRDEAVILNVARRQLTAEQIATVVANRLKKNPELSNRTVADEVKATPSKVAQIRKNLEEKGEIEKTAARQAADGGAAPNSSTPANEKFKEGGPPEVERFVDADGREVKSELADYFAYAKRMDVMATWCRTIGSHLKTDIAPWNKWLTRLAEAEECAKMLEKIINDCTPHVVCPLCNGDGCKVGCRMSGFMPEWRLQELRAEAKGAK